MSERKYVLTAAAAQQKLKRMSLEIAESLSGQTGELYLMGVQQSGMIIAEEMAKLLGTLLNKLIKTIAVQLNKQKPADMAIPKSMGRRMRILFGIGKSMMITMMRRPP